MHTDPSAMVTGLCVTLACYERMTTMPGECEQDERLTKRSFGV